MLKTKVMRQILRVLSVCVLCQLSLNAMSQNNEAKLDEGDLSIKDGEISVREGLLKKQKLNKKEKVDLTIVDIPMPDYDTDIDGTVVNVEIRNAGNTESVPCVALLENNEFDSIESGEEMSYYKAAVTLIPSLKPGESMRIQLKIPNYWIYDPNCEMRITLDALNQIPEKNKKNNVQEFAEYG